jgi:two-component system OmpR family response regulator
VSVRVFLVEDILTVRSIVPDMLCRLGGMQVVARAKGHADARSWLEAHAQAWDLAVIDLVLDGWWVADVIACARGSRPGGRVVVFSSIAAADVQARCLSAGADAVFPKMHVGDFASWLDAQGRNSIGLCPALATIRTEASREAAASPAPLRSSQRLGALLRKP